MLTFRGVLNLVKKTDKEMEELEKNNLEEFKNYVCFENVNPELPDVFIIPNKGIFYTNAVTNTLLVNNNELRKELDSSHVDYDVLQKKYDILLERYNVLLKKNETVIVEK